MSKALRINFELDRADNPPLYDELMGFTKGVKRVSRLRTLAYAGLLSQGPHQPVHPANTTARTDQQGHHNSATAEASLELFGPSADA